MNVLTVYIIKEILKGSFFAAILLLTLVNLFTLADELKDLGKGSYELKEIFIYLSLMSPQVFYELMPSSALLGSLFVLGAMANNREIVAMRVSGISLLGIIRPVLMAGGILVVISFVVGEFIAPESERNARLRRSEAQNKQVIIHSIYGFWMRDGDSYINVRQILEDGNLANISIYDLNAQHRMKEVRHAQKATYMGNEQWLLENISITEVSDQKVQASYMQQSTWQSTIKPDLLDIIVVSPENLSLYDLGTYIGFLQDNNQNSEKFELAFWGRLINPFITLIMLLVSAPFVIGFKRAQSTGPRMIIGILFGMSFNIIDTIFSNMGLVYDLNPVLVAVFPSAVVLTGAVYAISRLR